MRKRTNLKEVSNATLEQMTWDEIDRIARNLAVDLMDNEHSEIVRTLLLLMQEIGLHSHDQSHVGTISILMRVHLFAVTMESERAEEQLTAELREKFQKGGRA